MRSLRPRRLKQEREGLVPTVTAAAQFAAYRDRLADAVPLLSNAEPWSLFVPATHEAHYAALRRLVDTASTTPR